MSAFNNFARKLDKAIDRALLASENELSLYPGHDAEPPVDNHEIWRVCKFCGNWIDLRMSTTCDECGNDFEA